MGRDMGPILAERDKQMEIIAKWEKFDEQMRTLFEKNFHLGESRITIADYMQAQLDLGIIEISTEGAVENG